MRRPTQRRRKKTLVMPRRLGHLRGTRMATRPSASHWKVAILVNMDTLRSRAIKSTSPLLYSAVFSLITRECWCPVLAVSGFTRKQASQFLAPLAHINGHRSCLEQCLGLFEEHRERYGLGLWFMCSAGDQMHRKMQEWTTTGCIHGRPHIPLRPVRGGTVPQ